MRGCQSYNYKKFQDENDEAPIFTNVESGSVLENERANTVVMQVSAIDNDGTYPNNKVRFNLSKKNPQEILDKFQINPDTGEVRTKVSFDREEKSVYAVIIEAQDGDQSFHLQNGLPNITPQKFRINIADKNDNPPYFEQAEYHADTPEDADVDSKVMEVSHRQTSLSTSLDLTQDQSLNH